MNSAPDPIAPYDVVIVGGGPAGLSAALALGRARRRVLLCDAGTRRNAAAVHMHNFVTRDGITPAEFRRIGREQLEPYASVEVRDIGVREIRGTRGDFEVALSEGLVRARRILLCTGMVDEMLPIEGFRELWGTSIVQCPYCHGWEVRDRPFGVLAGVVEMLDFALLLRSWTPNVVALTNGAYPVPAEAAERLARAGVRLDERPIAKLVSKDGHLSEVAFAEGPSAQVEVLFAKPPQRQVDVVRSLGLALDPMGFVQVDPMHRETSVSGVYAGGDLVTPMQAAVMAAASGVQAAATLNHALAVELAVSGLLP